MERLTEMHSARFTPCRCFHRRGRRAARRFEQVLAKAWAEALGLKQTTAKIISSVWAATLAALKIAFRVNGIQRGIPFADVYAVSRAQRAGQEIRRDGGGAADASVLESCWLR
jgi:hypothetical protein